MNRVRAQWNASWRQYIETSKRWSSSALATAENLRKLGRIGAGSRVLDLGCGHGRVAELLVEKVNRLDLVGVDMTRGLLSNFMVPAGTNGAKIRLMCADIATLPFDDSGFDAVVSSRVFQYVPDPIRALREAVRVVKPGGRIVIAMPNKWNVIKRATYREKLYSPLEVRHWFVVCGLEDIECRSMCFFPPTTRWRRLASMCEVAARIPVLKHLGGNVLVSGKKPMK